jgi:phosphatidate cytidylyltransferase
MFRTLSNFQQRFLFGTLGAALVAWIIGVSHVPPFQQLFVATLALVQAIALAEYYGLCRQTDVRPRYVLGILASLVYIGGRALVGLTASLAFIPLFFVAIVFLGSLGHLARLERAIVDGATTCFGLLYITVPMSYFLDINFQTSSSLWLFYLILTTKITDTSAYMVGKLLGRRKLVPHISPNKTIAGAVGGIVGAVGTSVLFCKIAVALGAHCPLSGVEMIVLGACIGVVAELGDLVESLIKRDAAVKDSSTMPGFGGMLDVIDSLLFTTPMLYLYLRWKNFL